MWEDYPLEMTLLVAALGEPEDVYLRYAAWKSSARLRLCVHVSEGRLGWRIWIGNQRWDTNTFAATLALVSEPRWREMYL